MISSIVDGNGFLVYTGNDVNEKFARVLAIEGHSRIDVNSPDLEKIKWDGTKWIKGETDLEAWQKKMARSDGPFGTLAGDADCRPNRGISLPPTVTPQPPW